MKCRSGLLAAMRYVPIVALVTMGAGCSGRDLADQMESCRNAKDVKLLIKLKKGHPDSVKYDKFFEPGAEFAVVCPGRKLSWKLAGSQGFTIRFKTTSPFPWTEKQSSGGMVEDTVPEAPYGGYAYSVEVDGSNKPLDPIIIVDR